MNSSFKDTLTRLGHRIKDAFKALMQRLGRIFTGNVGLKAAAFVFALLLWAYVLVVLNPVRTKYIEGVTISLEGDTDLLSRNLILVEPDLGLADVVVSAEINNHSSLNASRINCRGYLGSITRAGTYTLPLSATVQSNLGTVTSVNPERITVEVDKIVTRTLPVTLVSEGQLSAGYTVLSRSCPSTVTVSGASRYIQAAVRAEAHVNLEGRVSSVEESVNLIFFDKEGNEITVITRSGETPSVNVSAEISPVKEVPVEVRYEIPQSDYYDVTFTQSRETVTLYGETETLAAIDSVKTEPVALKEAAGVQELETKFVVPEGVTMKSGQDNKLSVVFNVAEKVGDKELSVPITYEGLDRSLTFAGDKPAAATVIVSGPLKLLELVSADSITLKVSLTGLAAGEHEVVPVIEAKRKDKTASVSLTLGEPSIFLVLQNKE